MSTPRQHKLIKFDFLAFLITFPNDFCGWEAHSFSLLQHNIQVKCIRERLSLKCSNVQLCKVGLQQSLFRIYVGLISLKQRIWGD